MVPRAGGTTGNGRATARRGAPVAPRDRGRAAPKRPHGTGNGGVRVSEIQRARILTAMSELVCERGTAEVSVAQVVARSGVSRRTFYELFVDREDCFLAALDRAIELAGECVTPAYEGHDRWRSRIRAGLAALLEFLDGEPEMGVLCVVGALGAGPKALERRARAIGVLVDAVHEGRFEARSRRPERLMAEGVVGAVLPSSIRACWSRVPGPWLAC